MRGAPVLVVDDDPGLRDMVAQVLEDEGYRVLLATGGREALAHVAAVRPRPADRKPICAGVAWSAGAAIGNYLTVTLLARLRGMSGSKPRSTAR
jgi:CheY-like chemotaxis protein